MDLSITTPFTLREPIDPTIGSLSFLNIGWRETVTKLTDQESRSFGWDEGQAFCAVQLTPWHPNDPIVVEEAKKRTTYEPYSCLLPTLPARAAYVASFVKGYGDMYFRHETNLRVQSGIA